MAMMMMPLVIEKYEKQGFAGSRKRDLRDSSPQCEELAQLCLSPLSPVIPTYHHFHFCVIIDLDWICHHCHQHHCRLSWWCRPVIPRMLSKALRTLIRESDDVTAVVKRRWWPKSNTSATTNNIEADPLPSQPSVSQSPLLGLQLTFLGGWSPNRGGSKLAKTSRGGSTLAKETAWEPVCLVMTMMPIWWWWFDKSKKTRCGVSVGPSHHHHPFLAQRGLSATSAKQN